MVDKRKTAGKLAVVALLAIALTIVLASLAFSDNADSDANADTAFPYEVWTYSENAIHFASLLPQIDPSVTFAQGGVVFQDGFANVGGVLFPIGFHGDFDSDNYEAVRRWYVHHVHITSPTTDYEFPYYLNISRFDSDATFEGALHLMHFSWSYIGGKWHGNAMFMGYLYSN